jgi:hypothetical protein
MKAPSNMGRPANLAAIDERARRLRSAAIGDLMSSALTWVARAVASAVARLKAEQTLRTRSAR